MNELNYELCQEVKVKQLSTTAFCSSDTLGIGSMFAMKGIISECEQCGYCKHCVVARGLGVYGEAPARRIE